MLIKLLPVAAAMIAAAPLLAAAGDRQALTTAFQLDLASDALDGGPFSGSR